MLLSRVLRLRQHRGWGLFIRKQKVHKGISMFWDGKFTAGSCCLSRCIAQECCHSTVFVKAHRTCLLDERVSSSCCQVHVASSVLITQRVPSRAATVLSTCNRCKVTQCRSTPSSMCCPVCACKSDSGHRTMAQSPWHRNCNVMMP